MTGDLLHATCVALNGRGVLLRGPSGSGKSSVGIQMIGMGATLVSDDQVRVEQRGDAVFASAPDTLRGLIEIRGMGLARLATVPEAEVIAVVDMDMATAKRLPESRATRITSVCLPLIAGLERPYLASEMMALLRASHMPLFDDPDHRGSFGQ